MPYRSAFQPQGSLGNTYAAAQAMGLIPTTNAAFGGPNSPPPGSTPPTVPTGGGGRGGLGGAWDWLKNNAEVANLGIGAGAGIYNALFGPDGGSETRLVDTRLPPTVIDLWSQLGMNEQERSGVNEAVQPLMFARLMSLLTGQDVNPAVFGDMFASTEGPTWPDATRPPAGTQGAPRSSFNPFGGG